MNTPFIFKVATSVVFSIMASLTLHAPVQAQKPFSDHVKLGAAINYSKLHISDEAYGLKEALSYDTGYQLHALITHPLSSRFALESGIKGYLFRYGFDDLSSTERNSEGEKTGNRVVTSMKGDLKTTYLSIPVNLQLYPLESTFYLKAGTEFSYKVGYSNGTLVTEVLTPQALFSFGEKYTAPEDSRDFLLAAKTGLGINAGPSIPINIELTVIHSLTHYLDPDKFIDARIRGASLSVSYQLRL